jgi:hypothetical protein
MKDLGISIIDLFVTFKNDDDMTLAGAIDGYLIKNHFNDDYDLFEENNGYELRDKIIEQLTEGLDNKLNKLLK